MEMFMKLLLKPMTYNIAIRLNCPVAKADRGNTVQKIKLAINMARPVVRRLISQPAKGDRVRAPKGMPSNAMPNCPSLSDRPALISGSRASQLPNIMLNTIKVMPTARLGKWKAMVRKVLII